MNVGDTVFMSYFDKRRHKDLIPLKIEKIGRKWVTASGYGDVTFSRESMLVEHKGYSPIAAIYLSEHEFNEAKRRASLWSELRLFVDKSFNAPKHLKTDAIEILLGTLKDAT